MHIDNTLASQSTSPQARESSLRMIIHCPKCGYSRQPTDVAPPTECPECGIVFEKYLASPPRKPAAPIQAVRPQAPAKQSKSPESQPEKIEATVTSCPACGGTVAYGAKTCPHCGKSKPAPKPPTKVTKTHLVLALLLLLAIIGSQLNQAPPLTADEVTKICAREAGLEVNSSRAVTMQDLRTIDACVNRYGFKTKP